MIYPIYRRRLAKVGPHFNSPIRPEWKLAGKVNAESGTEAVRIARRATGAPVGDIGIGVPESTPAEDRNAHGFLAGFFAFIRQNQRRK